MTDTFASGTQALPVRWYDAGPRRRAGCILAPGAGAGQGHPFLTAMATALAARGVSVMTFDFPYMASGRRRPDPAPVLEAAWRDAIEFGRRRLADAPLFVGGKSMGGRLVTQVVAQGGAAGSGIEGVICLGYPLQPPGRTGPRSVDHLHRLGLPLLILQGTRDTFGNPDAIRSAIGPADTMEVHAVAGADHGFARPKSFPAEPSVVDLLADAMLAWMQRARPF